MIKYLVKVKVPFVALATLFLLTACVNVVTDNEHPCDPSVQKPVSGSKELDVNIHVDGSGSMIGYVTPSNSGYSQTIDLLDSTFSLGQGSRPIVVTYYRSGKGTNQSLDRPQFRQAKSSEFYNLPSSQLDIAITPLGENDKLLVFVTDLDQNGGDTTKLNDAIEERYLKNKTTQYAVGVLAIQSEYSGKVYTVDPKVYADFPYNASRPFYVLFVGPYQDIVDSYESMKKSRPELIEGGEFVIFYPGGMVKETTYLQGKPNLEDGLESPYSLNRDKVAFEPSDKNKSYYQFLEIAPRIDQNEFAINYTLPFLRPEYTLLPKPDSIEVQSTVKKYESSQKNFTEQTDVTLTQALELDQWTMTDNQLSFTTKLRPDNLTEAGIYLFTINAMAEDLQDAQWWKEWDWSSRKNAQDGSKTYNFLPFMQNLKRTTTDLMNAETQKATIGRFCYAIQKN